MGGGRFQTPQILELCEIHNEKQEAILEHGRSICTEGIGADSISIQYDLGEYSYDKCLLRRHHNHLILQLLQRDNVIKSVERRAIIAGRHWPTILVRIYPLHIKSLYVLVIDSSKQ